MKKLAAAALVAILPYSANASDFHAEIMEWVIEPCMEVAAALDVKTYRREQLDMGIKREQIAQLLAADRSDGAQNLADSMNADAPWENRSAAYVVMLKLCVQRLPGME